MTSDYGQPPESFELKPGKAFGKIIKILTEIVISIFGLALVALACIIIRLASAPIELDFLNADVESALNSSEIGVSGTIEGTQLAWREWTHPIEIQVRGLRLKNAQGQEILDVPEVGVSLSFLKLLEGEIALKKIRIYSPRIILKRDATGAFVLGVEEKSHGSEMSLDDFLSFLMIDPQNTNLGKLNSLRKISILQARLDVIDEDGKQNLSFPRLDLIINRRHSGFDADFKLYSPPKSGKVDLLISHTRGSDRADAQIKLSHASLASLFETTLEDVKNELDRNVEFLSKIEVPLSGEAHLAFNPKSLELIEGKTDVTIHHGELGSILEGGVSLGMNSGQIALEITPQSIILKNLGIYSGETLVNVSGSLISSHTNLTLSKMTPPGTKVKLDATLKDLPLKETTHYWPAFAAPGAREWIVERMSSTGVLEEANLEVLGAFTEDGYVSEKMGGTLSLKGGAVQYLVGLPLAEDVDGSAEFNADSFDIHLTKGHVGEAKLSNGEVKITGLSNDEEAIDINLNLDAKLPEVLQIIDHDPLGYAKKAGIDPTKAQGDVKGTLHFDFPLLADLKFDDVKINIEGDIQNVSLKTEIGKSKFPIDLEKGTLKVKVTDQGMTIKGPGVVNKIKANLEWDENFSDNPKSKFETRLSAHINATAEDLKRHDYDYTAFVSGATPFTLTYTKTSKKNSTLGFDFNLTPSKISIPHIGWEKKEGQNAALSFMIDLESGDLKHLNNINLKSDYIKAQGMADFDDKGDWQDLNLTHVQFDKTNATLLVNRPQNGGFHLKARGKEINAEPFMTYLDESEEQDRDENTPITIDAELNAIHMGEGKTFKQVKADVDLLLTHDDTIWNSVHLTAAAGKGTIDKGVMKDTQGGIWMEISKPQDGQQTLSVRANDAGVFFKNLNLFDDLMGGELTIKASRKVGQPFAGSFKIQDFDVKKIPLLARFAAVASPMGIVNLFSDGVVSFRRFDANFVYGDEIVEVKKGSGKSLSIGFTVEGKMNRIHRQLDLKGVVIPMYALNSILNNIPLIGSLLGGGEDEGIFAANYTVKGSPDNPDININTLSALVPGFIRNIFNGVSE